MVPPPPAFTLPIDFGLQLLAQRDQASHDLLTYSVSLPGDRAKARATHVHWEALQLRLRQLEAQVRKTQHDLDVAHDNLQAAAVQAYMDSGSSRLSAAITALASTSTRSMPGARCNSSVRSVTSRTSS